MAHAKNFPGSNYDLVAFFDCLHDMGDPVGAAKHVRQSLHAEGTWLIVEPFAEDRVEANFNPIGRMMYAASTMVCVPASMSQEVGLALARRPASSTSRCGRFRRFSPFPSRHGYAVQHGFRGATVTIRSGSSFPRCVLMVDGRDRVLAEPVGIHLVLSLMNAATLPATSSPCSTQSPIATPR